MKYIIIIIITAIALSAVFKPDVLNPAPLKTYKAYRERVMAAQGFSSNVASSAKWSMKIDSYTQDGTTAVIMATENTSKIPPNYTSHAFATKVTRQIKTVYFLQNGKWEMGTENIFRESTSTYEDRKQ